MVKNVKIGDTVKITTDRYGKELLNKECKVIWSGIVDYYPNPTNDKHVKMTSVDVDCTDTSLLENEFKVIKIH